MKNISIVIPNFNGLKILKKNLSSVIDLAEKNNNVKEIIIVDDCSNDGSGDYIKNNYPKIKLILKPKNTGFIDTVNIGVKSATEEYILLLNTDIRPSIDLITNLINNFTNDRVFAVGCLDQSFEGDKIIERGRGIGFFDKGFFIHKRGEIKNRKTLWISGGSGMFNKKIWHSLGGLDNLYSPFYWEDIDISYRALKSGYTIIFEPKAIVKHNHEEGAIKQNYREVDILKISFRNQLIFTWKNITDKNYLLSHVFHLPLFLIYHLLKGEYFYLKGFIDAFCKFPLILSSRKNTVKLFRKNDKEVLDLFRE